MNVDVLVIGGGPAGLSAALVLGRARRSVIVIDEELPRNRVTQKSHGFLTRDGITPSEFRAVSRAQIEAYPSVQFRRESVTAVAGADGNFQIQTDTGTTIQSRKLLFATGVKDVLPAIDGLEQVYGKSAFVCPYCDGWELRDQPLILIAKGDKALHMAKLLKGWTGDLTICTNGPAELTAEQRAELTRHGLPLYEDAITRIESEEGLVRTISLANGVSVPCAGIFFAPVLIQSTPLPEILGCQMTPTGAVAVGDDRESTVPGLYVAGDAAGDRHQLIMAAADGALAAIAMNGQLCEADWAPRATEPPGVSG